MTHPLLQEGVLTLTGELARPITQQAGPAPGQQLSASFTWSELEEREPALHTEELSSESLASLPLFVPPATPGFSHHHPAIQAESLREARHHSRP